MGLSANAIRDAREEAGQPWQAGVLTDDPQHPGHVELASSGLLDAIFEAADADGDGRVSRDEF